MLTSFIDDFNDENDLDDKDNEDDSVDDVVSFVIADDMHFE